MSTFFATIPKLSYLLCGQNPLSFVIGCVKFWYLLVVSEIYKIDTSVRFSFYYKKTHFIFRLKNKADIAVLKETFLMEEYKWKVISNPLVIVDLGAHIGDTAVYYHATFPEAKIYAVEPDPDLFKRLQENVKGIDQISATHAAISDHIGVVSLNRSARSSLSGSLMNRRTTSSSVDVPSLTLDELFSIHNIDKADLCKFDIEGSEAFLFKAKNAAAYADAYIGELHGDLMDMSIETFLESFKDFSIDIEPIGRKNRFNMRAKKI